MYPNRKIKNIKRKVNSSLSEWTARMRDRECWSAGYRKCWRQRIMET